MNKLIATLLLSTAISTTVIAQEVNIMNPYRPGGTGSMLTLSLQEHFEKSGVKVNLVNVENCTRNNDVWEQLPNAISVGFSLDREECQIKLKQTEQLDLLFVLAELICTNNNSSIIDILNKKPLKIAVATSDNINSYFYTNLKAISPNITLVPYRNSGEQITAASVKEVDFSITNSLASAKAMNEKRVDCKATTEVSNPKFPSINTWLKLPNFNPPMTYVALASKNLNKSSENVLITFIAGRYLNSLRKEYSLSYPFFLSDELKQVYTNSRNIK